MLRAFFIVFQACGVDDARKYTARWDCCEALTGCVVRDVAGTLCECIISHAPEHALVLEYQLCCRERSMTLVYSTGCFARIAQAQRKNIEGRNLRVCGLSFITL
jgi:hypothetical protein